jgi:hypothetical protein
VNTYLHEFGVEPYKYVHTELFDTYKDRNQLFRGKEGTT